MNHQFHQHREDSGRFSLKWMLKKENALNETRKDARKPFSSRSNCFNVLTTFENSVRHPRVHVHTVYAKSFQRTRKKVHAHFGLLSISKILERYFTGMFYYCFI